jgi:hypothetical protein
MGGLVVLSRLLSRKRVSPGEWLILMVGAQQAAACLSATTLCREIDVLPLLQGETYAHEVLFLERLPALVGSVLALSATMFSKYAGWAKVTFAAAGMCLLLPFLGVPFGFWFPDNALATIGSPFTTGFTALTLAGVTICYPDGYWANPRWHWTCLACCLIPLAWLIIWWEKGLVGFRALSIPVAD